MNNNNNKKYWKFPEIIICNINNIIKNEIKSFIEIEPFKNDWIFQNFDGNFYYIQIITLDKAKILYKKLKSKFKLYEILLPINKNDNFYRPMIEDRFIRKAKNNLKLNNNNFPNLEKDLILNNKKEIYNYFINFKENLKINPLINKFKNYNIFSFDKIIVPEELEKTKIKKFTNKKNHYKDYKKNS